MSLPIVIFSIILCLVTMLLHSIGCWLLISLYVRGEKEPEELFLINVSLSGLVFTTSHLLITPLRNITSLSLDTLIVIENVQSYIAIFDCYGGLIYYVCMIFLSVDRLLYIALDIRYHIYINVRRTSILLKSTWSIGLLLTLGILIIYAFTKIDTLTPLFRYIYPPFDFVFIIIAFGTYGFLFRKYSASKKPPAQRARTESMPITPIRSNFEIFQTSRFYVPVCLIANFLLFIVIPDILYILYVSGVPMNFSSLNNLYSCSFIVSCFCDAVVYIFLSSTMKKLLVRKLRLYRSKRNKSKQSEDIILYS